MVCAKGYPYRIVGNLRAERWKQNFHFACCQCRRSPARGPIREHPFFPVSPFLHAKPPTSLVVEKFPCTSSLHTGRELERGLQEACTYARSHVRGRSCTALVQALARSTRGRCARWGVFVFFYWPEFGRSRTCGLRHCQALGSLPPQRAHHGCARTPRTTRVDPALCSATGTSYTDRARTPRKCQWQGAHVQR